MGRWSLRLGVLGIALGCGGVSSRNETDRSSGGGSGGTAGAAPNGGAAVGGAAGGTAGATSSPGEEEVACAKNSDCVFAMKQCCRCNAYSLDDVVAVNRSYADDVRSRACQGNSPCPSCTTTMVDPALVASCQEGRCTGLNLFETEITACDTADDCKFRSSACCGCMDPPGSALVIPINREQDGAYEAVRCDPGAACAECALEIPEGPDFLRGCDGHCVILGFVP